MQTEIKQWGNSAAVRLPMKILAAAQLSVCSEISLTVEDGKIVIEALPDTDKKRLHLPFTEAQLLNGLTAETAHADAVAHVSGVEVGD